MGGHRAFTKTIFTKAKSILTLPSAADSSRNLSSPSPGNRLQTRIIRYGLIVVALVVYVLLTWQVFTKPFPGFNDYMTIWEASRSYFYDGLDPYSAETSLNIQTRLYGRAALPDEQPNHYAYPFYTIFASWPFIHFEYTLATAMWVVLLQASLVGSLILLLDMYRWKPRPLTLAGLVIFCIVCYPGARGLILGQISHLVYFLQVLALWALVKRRDKLSGVALAFSTLKPQMVVLFVPLLLLWGLSQRRWRLIASFGVTLSVLVGLSFLMQPDWVSGFLYQLQLYPTYIEVSTPAWVIAQYLLGLGSGAELVLNLLGLVFVLWTWFALIRRQTPGHFLWTVMIALTMTHLVGLRTASPHFIVLIVPLLFYLRNWARQRKPLWIGLTLFALFLLPWLHFTLTIGDRKFEHPTVFLPLPLLALIVLLLTRRQWWGGTSDVLP
jgi:hypothetical protein